MKLLTVLIALSLVSCAHRKTVKLPKREYMKDKVSVKTVFMQAHAAYIRGCLEAHKSHDKKTKWFEDCKEKADRYLETDIMAVMDQ